MDQGGEAREVEPGPGDDRQPLAVARLAADGVDETEPRILGEAPRFGEAPEHRQPGDALALRPRIVEEARHPPGPGQALDEVQEVEGVAAGAEDDQGTLHGGADASPGLVGQDWPRLVSRLAGPARRISVTIVGAGTVERRKAARPSGRGPPPNSAAPAGGDSP